MTAKETKLTSPRKFSSISSLKEVSESEWDACAGDENPFLKTPGRLNRKQAGCRNILLAGMIKES